MIFNIIEIKPRIFFFEFKDYYTLGMHFVRYQEFYESTSDKFRGKSFKLLDYMRWYQKEYGNGVFSYPKDWYGYNFPGNIIKQVNDLGIMDRNDYDDSMLEAYNKCLEKYSDFYIIGAIKDDDVTLKHELAHGLFYLSKPYKEEMISLINKIPSKIYNNICQKFIENGYNESVHMDETQAFLSIEYDSINIKGLKKFAKQFRKVYTKYSNI
jgi:hypothetical protein